MNLKNLMMWSVIILLVVGLFQLFKNPKSSMVSDKMPFSEFLKNIDDGRVVQVEIRGIIFKVFYQTEQLLTLMLLTIQI